MGQTLTHGVYLPDEGERNCYSGLAANWQILDTSVGTIAEHTSALSGKAPLVHTHTKSDITDLLNSDFIPSANNAYDLGSSSYQWNNLYAKNYYYNGVAWGLDKENVWSANQKITNNPSYLYFKNTSMTMGTAPTSNKFSGAIFQDSNNTELGNVTYKKHKNSNNVLILNVKNTDGTNNYECSASLSLTPSGSASFYPEGVDCNLGQSTTPWKTLNGINPGALSLPDYNRFEPIDFSQWDVNLGWNNLYTPSEDGWLYAEIVDAATNSIYVYSATIQPVQGVQRKYGASAQGNGSQQTGYGGGLAVMIPVRKGIQYRFLIKASAVSDIYNVVFYPCLGNV